MSGPCCCSNPAVAPARRRAGPARRCLSVVEWLAPAAVLVAMPKCPACLAGYVAVATGLGVSVASAAQLRTAAIALSLASLACLVIVRGRGHARRRLGPRERGAPTR